MEGPIFQEYLMKRQGNSWNSYRGQHWDEFSLDHIRTSSARIDVIDVYTTYHNGFNEIEFYTGISELLSLKNGINFTAQ